MLDADFVTILRKHLKYLPDDAELPLDAGLRDLGLDSMAAIALMLDLEDELGRTIPDDALTAETLRTSRTLWTAIEDLAAA